MNTKNPNVLVLAHYYTSPEVQSIADYVGDSLDLSLKSKEAEVDSIVFAGVKFMAETARIINTSVKQVILPDASSTCSLVIQSDENNLTDKLKLGRQDRKHRTIVTYINSSYQVKALSDVIVTSANVEDIVSDLINSGKKVFFTPDRNMGAYLAYSNPDWRDNFRYYKQAVCEVHDKFVSEKLNIRVNGWTDYPTILLAHPESPLPVLKQANLVGSTRKMLEYVKEYKGKGLIYVATEEGLLYNMREARPDLDIRLAPVYTGCQCNACPYMQKNTLEAVQSAIEGKSGLVIDYIPESVRLKALLPIERMLNWRS